MQSSKGEICSLEDGVRHFSRALALLSVEKKFQLSAVDGGTNASSDNVKSDNTSSSVGKSEGEEQSSIDSSLTLSELKEYTSLALAYVNLRLNNWSTVQFILKKLLSTSMISDRAR